MLKPKKSLSVIVLTGMLVLSVVLGVSADSPKSDEHKTPIGYSIAPDGHKIPLYLLPEDVRLTKAALDAGIITEEQVAESRALLESTMATTAGDPWCPWGGTVATLISEGWDADDDYYKDYEHPVGWNDDFVCMTVFYWGWTGGNGPAHEYHFDYKPSIARHRLKIGLTDFPGWFASAQAEMRWNH